METSAAKDSASTYSLKQLQEMIATCLGSDHVHKRFKTISDTSDFFRVEYVDAGFPDDRIIARIDTMRASSVADCIIREQEEMKCCTIVIGRRGISRKEEFIFGSTSNRIVHEAKKCAVLVIE